MIAMNINPTLLKGVRVLCVDDNIDIVELLKFSLMQYGAEVETALGIDQALKRFDSFGPNVLICDICLGEDKTGYDLISEVRNLPDPKERYIPAIALTGLSQKEVELKAINLGFSYFMKKPILHEELAAVIAQLTGRL
jgi:two-component system, OmpR family, response regulator